MVSKPKEPKLPEDPASAIWEGAAGRLIEDGSGTPLQRLRLVTAMYNYLESDQLLPIISAAIADLSDSEIEGVEAELCANLIEELYTSELPSETQEHAQWIVFSASAKMLSEYGDALSLDEIERVIAALFEYGIDENMAAEAGDKALQAHIAEVSRNRDFFDSVDELESHKKQLKKLVDDCGCSDEIVFKMERALQRHEERL